MSWKLKRTNQCKKCPWRVSTDPHEIPNGYSLEAHVALRSTISSVENPLHQTHVMSCHEHPKNDEAHCVGWLANQLGPGNNLGLRLKMLDCENSQHLNLDGEQHDTFDQTLPK